MADTIWVYAEIGDDKITTTSLEMLAKAAVVGKAEAVLLGPAIIKIYRLLLPTLHGGG